MSPYVRTVKTASGATAVQVVWSNRLGSKRMDHIGSAHTPEDVEILKAVAQQRMAEGQDELDFGGGGQPPGAGVDDPRVPRRAPVGGVVSRISGGGFGWHQRR